MAIPKDRMYHKFRLYGFLKNLRFFDPFLVLFFREMGLSFLEIGILFSVREISTNFFEIPTGILADTYGRRKAMLASFSSYLVSFLLFYLFSSFSVCLVAMVLFAIAEAFRSGTHKAMILEYLRIKQLEQLKVDYYGHTRAASQLGSALAALIAAGLVFYAGSYRIVFAASIIPYILELFLISSYPKELDGEIVTVEGAWMKRLKQRILGTSKEFLKMLRNPLLVRGLFSSAGFDAIFKSAKDYLQPILKSQALALPIFLCLEADRRIAIVVGGVYFVIYLVTSWAAASSHRLQSRARSPSRAVNFSFVIGVALLLVAGVATWTKVYALSIAAFLALYFLQNVRRPMLVGYLSEVIPHQAMATGLSVESEVRALIMAGLFPLIGLLADRVGVGLALVMVALGGVILSPILRVPQTGQAIDGGRKSE
jgi:MFS family permease